MSSKDISYLQLWRPFCSAKWLKLSLTKFVRFTIVHRKMDAVGHFIFKALPQCYSRVRCLSNKRQCIERHVWLYARYT